MSIVGEATGVFGLLGKALNLLRDRLDPARAQAKRFIETFETYGIARQQIPSLLTPEPELANASTRFVNLQFEQLSAHSAQPVP
jgi:hypothetical protein